jgi:hypothetical protein
MSDPAPTRKKRSRFWLFAPYVVIAVLAVGYGAYWMVAKTRLERGIDAQAEAMRKAGYSVDIAGRRIDGFPFRLKASFPELRIASPAGWAIAASGLAGQAYLHAPGHWVFTLPGSLSVTRPKGGELTIKGETLRASVAGLGGPGWRFAAEGIKLAFTPGVGAAPFSLARADRIDLNAKPGSEGTDQLLMLVRLQAGHAGQGAILHRIVAETPVTGLADLRLTKARSFAGPSFGSAARTWAEADGRLEIVRIELQGGQAAAWAKGGSVSAGRDGRMEGVVPLELRQAPKSIAALAGTVAPETARTAAEIAAARDRGGSASLNLVFQAGVTTLGPVPVGPSPRVF